MTDFQYETELGVRYRDADPAGHVNNAVMATYLEQGRVDYLQDLIGEHLGEGRAVVAHLEIDYERAVRLGTDAVTVAVATTRMGTTSVDMDYEVRAGGETAATGESTMVVTDPADGTPQSVPEDWREAIAEFEGIDPGA